MVSLFPSFQIKGEMTHFIGKGRPLFFVNFQCGIASHKGKKNPKPQNLGSTIIYLNFIIYIIYLKFIIYIIYLN